MPLFSLNKIAALAANRQTYLRGVSAYSAGCVSALACRADSEYAERLTAQVTDRTADTTFSVEVDFNTAGEVVHYQCDCGGTGACKHVVAALTHKYYRDMVGGMPAATSKGTIRALSPQASVARRMLDGYFREAQTAIRAGTPTAPAHLFPALHLDTPPALTLSVGAVGEHAYVIKDMAMFRDRLRRGDEVTYGARLTLVHHPDAFEPDSRPLLALVTTAAMTGTHARRELPLSPTELDRFFTLYEGQTLPVCGGDATLQRGDPPFTIEVEPADDGVTLICPPPRFAVGEAGMYVLAGAALYAASPAFTAATRGLLPALRECGGRLPLCERELAEFCGSVLPAVEPFVTFTGEVARFDPYRPLSLSAAVYIDQPDPLTLTARLEFRYGERVFIPAADGDTLADPAEGGVARDRLGELRARLAVMREFPARSPETGLFLRACTDETLYDFLTTGLPALSHTVDVYMSDAFRKTRVVAPPRMAVGVRLSAGLLELDFDLGGLDRAELSGLLASYRQRKRYHRLRSGAFLSLDDPALLGLSRLSEGLALSDRQLQSGYAAVPAFRAPFVDRVLSESHALGCSRNEALRALLKAVKTVEDSEFTPPDTLAGSLRGYQRTGFRWLRTMETYGFGGILADDMGLGKTVQMIALLLDAQTRGVTLPSLVVCPASLVLNWESELRRFAPSLTVRTVLGDSTAREAVLRQVGDGDVVITSYDLLKRDAPLYRGRKFHYHVLDEAQYIKNHTTQNARAVKEIDSVQRFALTGTPVENRLSELWSIFDFLMPGFLFSYARFRDRFELPAVRDGDTEALESLSRLCGSFILRRLKKDVLRELPPKTETVLCVPMEEEQRRTYLAAALQMREELATGDREGHTRLQALTMLTRLRQICCDPTLCYENYRGGSAKRESCIELVKEAVETGHRVLLFSQFTSMLAILEGRLRQEGIDFFTLQGSTPKEKRAAMVNAFNSGESVPVFLISLKAGGTGLNLTAADVVIHYDPWWNLSVQNQATDRAHRIGQQRPVQVYKLIAQDTVEEKILRLQEVKQSLADAVVHADGISLSALSDEELLRLLL